MKAVWTLPCAVLLLGLCAGCVQAQVSSRPEPASLMISRGTNGVNMQWEGVDQTVYTLYYRDTVGADTSWKAMPGYENIVGKGELIEFTDKAPTAKSRRYRVHTVKLPPSPRGN